MRQALPDHQVPQMALEVPLDPCHLLDLVIQVRRFFLVLQEVLGFLLVREDLENRDSLCHLEDLGCLSLEDLGLLFLHLLLNILVVQLGLEDQEGQQDLVCHLWTVPVVHELQVDQVSRAPL